jgi:hypothetical protein
MKSAKKIAPFAVQGQTQSSSTRGLQKFVFESSEKVVVIVTFFETMF